MQWMKINKCFQTIKSNAIGWDGSFFELVKRIKQIQNIYDLIDKAVSSY